MTKRKTPLKQANNSINSGNVRLTCSSKFTRKFDSYDRSESVSSDPSFNSEEWIREFNTRCRTLPNPKIQRREKAEVVEDKEQTNFYANIPSTHSTPVSCRIVPLNRNEIEERKTLFLPDLSGVKIYESVELGSDGNEVDTSAEEEAEDDYEVVTFKSQKLVSSTLTRAPARPPRNLKSSCR